MHNLRTTLKACTIMLVSTSVSPLFADTDVSHNWNSEGEAAAMRIFREKYEQLGGEWKDTSFPETQASIASVKTRFIGGNPPMALQSALGGVMRDFAEAGLLQDMTSVAEAGGWGANVSASMAAVGQHDGAWVAAPVFIDVINTSNFTNGDCV